MNRRQAQGSRCLPVLCNQLIWPYAGFGRPSARILVVAGDGIVEEVHVAAAHLSTASSWVKSDVERHQRPQLLLESDRALPAVGIAVVGRDDRRLLRRLRHARRTDSPPA